MQGALRKLYWRLQSEEIPLSRRVAEGAAWVDARSSRVPKSGHHETHVTVIVDEEQSSGPSIMVEYDDGQGRRRRHKLPRRDPDADTVADEDR